MSDCADARYRMFPRCKFEARYDLSPADLSGFKSISSCTPAFIETLRRKTYVKDVCIRCGKTIKRED